MIISRWHTVRLDYRVQCIYVPPYIKTSLAIAWIDRKIFLKHCFPYVVLWFPTIRTTPGGYVLSKQWLIIGRLGNHVSGGFKHSFLYCILHNNWYACCSGAFCSTPGKIVLLWWIMMAMEILAMQVYCFYSKQANRLYANHFIHYTIQKMAPFSM